MKETIYTRLFFNNKKKVNKYKQKAFDNINKFNMQNINK